MQTYCAGARGNAASWWYNLWCSFKCHQRRNTSNQLFCAREFAVCPCSWVRFSVPLLRRMKHENRARALYVSERRNDDVPTVVIIGSATRAVKRNRLTTLKMAALPPACGKKLFTRQSTTPSAVAKHVHTIPWRWRRCRFPRHIALRRWQNIFFARLSSLDGVAHTCFTRHIQDPITHLTLPRYCCTTSTCRHVPFFARHPRLFYIITVEEGSSLAYAWAESGVGGYDELGEAFEVTTQSWLWP